MLTVYGLLTSVDIDAHTQGMAGCLPVCSAKAHNGQLYMGSQINATLNAYCSKPQLQGDAHTINAHDGSLSDMEKALKTHVTHSMGCSQ